MEKQVLVCFIGIGLFCACNCKADTENSELREFLHKGCSLSEKLLEDIRVVVNVEGKYLDENLKDGPEDDGFYYICEYAQKDRRELFIREYSSKKSPSRKPGSLIGKMGSADNVRYTVLNQGLQLSYWPTKGSYDETQKGRGTLGRSDEPLLAQGHNRPLLFLGYRHGVMPTDVLASPKLELDAQPEEVGGLSTYKVTAPLNLNKVAYNVVYWLAPERSALPARMELRTLDGKLVRILETREFMEIEGGRWIIKQVIERFYKQDEIEEKAEEIENITYTIRDLELKPKIDDRVFSTVPSSLPVGALFTDFLTGLEYTIGEGAISDEIVDRIIMRAMGDIDGDLGSYSHLSEFESKGTEPNTVAAIRDIPEKPLFSSEGVFHSSDPQNSGGGHRTEIWGIVLLCVAAAATAVLVIRRRLAGK